MRFNAINPDFNVHSVLSIHNLTSGGCRALACDMRGPRNHVQQSSIENEYIIAPGATGLYSR